MDRAGTILELATVAALGVHNFAVNRVVDSPYDDAFNLLSATGLTIGARRNGLTWSELGLDPRHLGRGALVGAAAGSLSATAVAAAATLPATQRFFHDERVADVSRLEVLYHTVLRIPLATALAEEVLFRGVLEATIARGRSRRVAGIASSLLFGVWHILPTLRTFEGNLGTPSHRRARTAAVAVTVASTSAAGGFFLWLRRRTGSVAAPVLAHAAINATAYAMGRSVVRRAAEKPNHPGE